MIAYGPDHPSENLDVSHGPRVRCFCVWVCRELLCRLESRRAHKIISTDFLGDLRANTLVIEKADAKCLDEN